MIHCPKCGIAQNDSTSFCTVCGSVLDQSVRYRSEAFRLSLWEKREGSLFVALWKTVIAILKQPTTFFTQINVRSDRKSALLFFILLTVIAIPATMLQQSFDSNVNTSLITAQIMIQPIAMILLGVSGIFVGAAFLIILFKMTGVHKASYKETVTALCYTNAPLLLMILPIPFVPLIVAGIWSFALQIIGTATINHCSIGKMALIQIIPLVISIIFFIISIVLLVVLATAVGISLTDSLKIQDILDLIR